MAKSKGKKRRKFLLLFFIAFIISYFGYTLFQQQREIIALEKQKSAFQEEIQRAENELERLNEIIELGESDEYIEKMAREQLNMVKQDEIIIKDLSNIGK